MDDFERDVADAYLWRAVILNAKENRNDHMLQHEQVFGNNFAGRKS